MAYNKKNVTIIGLGLIVVLSIAIHEWRQGRIEVNNNKDNYYGDTYEDDPYEKFLQEEVLPNMIKNNKVEGCTLPSQDEEVTKEPINLGEGTIVLEDDDFIDKIDEIYINLDKYIGRDIIFEGLVFETNQGESKRYIVGRYYEEAHDDHSHENIIGIDIVFHGQELKANSWVKVNGTIEKEEFNGQEIPIIKVKEVIVKSEEG